MSLLSLDRAVPSVPEDEQISHYSCGLKSRELKMKIIFGCEAEALALIACTAIFKLEQRKSSKMGGFRVARRGRQQETHGCGVPLDISWLQTHLI